MKNNYDSKENDNFNLIIKKIQYENSDENSKFSSNRSDVLSKAMNEINEKEVVTEDRLIDSGVSNYNINFKDFQIIVIDDQANTYYPFLSFFFYDINMSNSYKIEKKNALFLSQYLKVIIYNYFAGKWEVLIEKSLFQLEVHTNYSDKNETKRIINISLPSENKEYSALNINISDISVIFS